MAYFDNAATTFPKPQEVYDFMDKFYRQSGGNFGRGNYALAERTSDLIKDTRSRIQKLLHCPNKAVIFEPTATLSLNIIIQGMIKNGVQNVYISPFEHNAVTRTLHQFEKEGSIQVSQLFVTSDLKYDLERIRYQFDDVKPDFVIVSHASNVIGLVAPVEEIFTLAKRYEAITCVDMAQTAGLVDLNVGSDVFDFAVFAGHKTLYGPTGISGFVMNPAIHLPAVLFGGTGFDSANQDMPSSLPERYEMGTLNIAGVAGLNAALKWIEKVTPKFIRETENRNRERLLRILEDFPFITLVGNTGDDYVGIVSFLIDGISSDSAGSIFDKNDVAVRTGLHCAPLAHRFLGTFPAGTIRLSVNYFTEDEDFEELEELLYMIESEL